MPFLIHVHVLEDQLLYNCSLIGKGKNKELSEEAGQKWKWISMKQSGNRPSPRCGFTLTASPGNRAMLFGGVLDEVKITYMTTHCSLEMIL